MFAIRTSNLFDVSIVAYYNKIYSRDNFQICTQNDIVQTYALIKIFRNAQHDIVWLHMRQMCRLFQHTSTVFVICCIRFICYLLHIVLIICRVAFFWGGGGSLLKWVVDESQLEHTIAYAPALIHAYTAHEYNYQTAWWDNVRDQRIIFWWISPALHVIPQTDEWTVEHSHSALSHHPSMYISGLCAKKRVHDFFFRLIW